MEVAILVFLVLVFIAVGVILLRILKDAPDRAEMVRLRQRESDYEHVVAQLQERIAVCGVLEADKARLEANLDNEKRNAEEKLVLLKESEERLKKEFENLASKIVEDKGRLLTSENRERLSELLKPFKDDLESFRRRVDEVHKNDTEQSVKLLEQVRQLHEMSNKVSDEANNLAKAIKGDSKAQGDWGELIIERIIEAAGLEKGREYDTQVTQRAEDGSAMRMDFVIYLPGNKSVIIDSKVSLTAYAQFCEAVDEEAQSVAMGAHLDSVYKHVNELIEKDYSQLLGSRTLDFVIMCVPNEPAYQAALRASPELIYDLAKTNVVMTGPTTLMITLKLISQIWRRENENRNAERIADRAGRMYDQVTLIIEAMLEAQRRLGGVTDSFDLALKRLKDGRGNLVGRVEELRRLGAKVNKQLSAAIVQEAGVDEDDTEEEDVAT
jgi:DNA recombination protein RmuC